MKIIYLWFWHIPTKLGLFALIVYFGIIYLCYGTISVAEIRIILGNNEMTFFLYFWLPFAIPMLLSLGSTFGGNSRVKTNSLEDAITFRNGQMNLTSDLKAAKILKNTNYLDFLNSNDSEVFQSARRGFDAEYGVKPPTEVFKELMNNKNG